jgi:cellulose biosynthesis protein BcsQ/tetratricopeptide (TPR) repeat protein
MTENRNGRVVTFYSYKGGTGRTMALANTAWILAANGNRVLTVDWDLEAPGLHRFFHPFLKPALLSGARGVIDLITDYQEAVLQPADRPADWYHDYARARTHAISLDWEFPGEGSLDFLPAGQQQNREYSTTLYGLDWDDFYNRYGGGQFFDALKDDMRRHYDYVLIDSRTGLSDTADICTVQMPDTLVVCFTLSDQSIDGAARVARYIDDMYRTRGIRILPVPMRIDEGEKEKADAGRALSRLRFDGLPHGLRGDELARYWGSVEIPYRPFYAYEEILATFGDAAGLSNSMLSACERLTSVISEGTVTGLPPLAEDRRQRYASLFTRRRPSAPGDILLSYAAEDRMWADWIESVLAEAGFRVFARDIGAAPAPGSSEAPESGTAYRTVVVLSPAYLRVPQARALADSGVVGAGAAAGIRDRLLAIRVGELPRGHAFSRPAPLNLVLPDETHATAALLRAMGRTDAIGAVPPSEGPRFPATRPEVWNVPNRNSRFIGRAAVMEGLRSRLGGGMAAAPPVPQALTGLGGVGKTQVALEYAHRFQADYDLVWWISAEQPEQVALGLADLARRLNLRVGDSVYEAAESAREALRRGTFTTRWLLIFDNADNPDQVQMYFPSGPGHVLITSRNQAWQHQAEILEVDVFSREESIEHLTHRAAALTREQADLVARTVGDLPLAVEVAGAWLAEPGTSVETYLEQLEEQMTKALGVTKAVGYPELVEAAWNVSIERVERQSPAAVRLLQLCAFFAAEPISVNLYDSPAMKEALLPYDPGVRGEFAFGKVIQAVGRYALAKVDPETNSIQVHRVVQSVIQSQMDGTRQLETIHEVHRILTGARPSRGDTDDPNNWPAFEEIWPHLGPSRAADCDESETRRLLIDRVRYLWKRGDYDGARTLGERLDVTWTRSLGENDPQTLQLRFQLANVLRSQGAYEAARALNENTLERQQAVLQSEDEEHVLRTAGSLAADLRALGRFKEALARDQDIHQRLKESLGDNHRLTLAAANNLAVDYRLVGNPAAARELDDEILSGRQSVLGHRHPYTLATKANLARDLRESGDYEASVTLLEEVREEYLEIAETDLPETLRSAKSLAVSLRRAGRREEAKKLTVETYDLYLERYGPYVPDALACAANLAADYSVAGEKDTARDVAQRAYDGHVRVLGEHHAFTIACASNLSIYLRGSGEYRKGHDLALRAQQGLEDVLGPEHPFTLCGLINLANAYGDFEAPDKAEPLERVAVEGLTRQLGGTHPDTLVAEGNLAVTQRALGKHDQARRFRDRALSGLSDQLGAEHPNTLAVRDWLRTNRDLEPQPL